MSLCDHQPATDPAERHDDVSSQKQCLLVMRHGRRQDEVESAWASTSLRPWDPPLSADGIDMVSIYAFIQALMY